MTTVRELTHADLDVVVEINNAGYPAVPVATHEELERLFEMSSYRRAALDSGGDVVGFALALDPGADYDSENYVFSRAVLTITSTSTASCWLMQPGVWGWEQHSMKTSSLSLGPRAGRP